MSIKAVLFDLDGTLLPMDQEVFTKAYFKGLAAKLSPLGYDPKELVSAIWSGTYAMIKNNGEKTNEEVFWDSFASLCGERVREDEPVFDEFYRTDFGKVKDVCGYSPQAAEIIKYLKAKGVRVALATNPIFPAIATESRIRWCGLEPTDFELYTTYENIGYCKPNPMYFKEILKRMDLNAEECLMVGNDVGDDMVAEDIGMKVFLLTDCLINKEGRDVSALPQGDFTALLEYIKLLQNN